MEDALEEIQFLANSANRIRVLDALAGGPATRRDLQEVTEVPRSTAARVLDEVLRDEPDRTALRQDIAPQVYVYDGPVPINMHILDGAVLVWLCDADRNGNDVIVNGLLESEHPEVLSWAESFYEDYREAAKPLRTRLVPSA